MITNKSLNSCILLSIFCLIALIGTQCSSSTKIIHANYNMRQVNEADSLFKTGNYELAKLKYIKIRDTNKNPAILARAQYYLGYINIYYENPFADYEAALREFKRFASLFPNDDRIELANNWIRILTAMRNFDTGFQGSSDKLKKSQWRQNDISRNYTNLQEAYLNCDALKDSLNKRIKFLEGVIEKLGKLE